MCVKSGGEMHPLKSPLHNLSNSIHLVFSLFTLQMIKQYDHTMQEIIIYNQWITKWQQQEWKIYAWSARIIIEITFCHWI